MVSFADNGIQKGKMMSEKKKCGVFCRMVRIALWCALGAVVVVLLAVAATPLWVGPVVTGLAGKVVPQFTGTGFAMERCCVNPWTGTVRIGGVCLSNPEGFGSAPALSVKSFSLDVAIFEILDNRLHVRDLVVEDAFASYYSHGGTNNMEVILANVNRALGPGKPEEKKAEEPEQKSEMKVLIDHVRISGTKVKLMESDAIPPLPFIDIEMRDIGKESGGATFAEVGKAFTDAFAKGLSSVGSGIGALGGALGSGIKDASSALGDTATSAAGGAKAASDAVEGAVSGGKAAAEAVGDATKKTTESVKGFFKSLGK